jgi:hypothetical protein
VAILLLAGGFLTASTAGAAWAWGSGGGGGGAPPEKNNLTKQFDKDMEDYKKNKERRDRERQTKQRESPQQQKREDAQYKPGFSFGPGGDLDLQR